MKNNKIITFKQQFPQLFWDTKIDSLQSDKSIIDRILRRGDIDAFK